MDLPFGTNAYIAAWFLEWPLFAYLAVRCGSQADLLAIGQKRTLVTLLHRHCELLSFVCDQAPKDVDFHAGLTQLFIGK
jgi:hypothetical protein